jgi:type VII secretion integral membrane protein EccD
MPRPGAPQTGAPPPPLCRVTVIAPRRKADLALPADIPLPHLLPGLLRALGEVAGDPAAAHGWALQRVGGPPLDLGQSLGALGVLDGEILYLRRREQTVPPALFDDVADVVATGVNQDGGVWGARHTRMLGGGGAAGLLAIGAVMFALSGAPATLSAIVTGILALLLVTVGAAVSRAAGDAGTGALIGYAALPYGFLTGLFAPAAGGVLAAPGAPHLLSGLACTALVATIAGALIGDGTPAFLGVVIASVTGALAAAAVMVFDVPAAGAAALAATLLLALSPLIPTLAFRLAGVPLPALPTTAEELRADNHDIDSAAVLDRTRAAQRHSTGMVIGIALAALGAELFLAAADGWAATAMALALALTLAMRARVFHGIGQRLWLHLTALTGLAALAVSRGTAAGTVPAVALMVGILWAALILLALALWLPTARLSPFWARAADITDLLLVVTLIPLSLAVLDLYATLRGLAG